MRKSIAISLLLVLSLLLGSFGTARAAVGDDPVVTPVSGDLEFTSEIVPIAHLPGTTQLASQMLVPLGFPAGEAQFGGNGVRVSGMSSGKATACFSLNTVAVNQGWGGKVGVWNGVKWVLLPTAISTTSDESASTSACATISGNGTYAFITYVAEPDKLPKNQCPYVMETWFWEFEEGVFDISVYFPNGDLPGPTLVTYQVLEFSPQGSLSGSLSGSVVGGMWWADFTDLIVDLETFDYATLHISYPGCSTNLTWHSTDPIDYYEGYD